MREPRVIRKYANRRLYDTATSKHINKERVREIIAGGEDVQVIDDATGDDITRNMLLQIVADQELGGRPILSKAMLTQIIRFYGHPMQGLLAEYLQKSFELFLAQQQNVQEQMRRMIMEGPISRMQEMATRSMEAWVAMQKAAFGRDRDEDERDDD